MMKKKRVILNSYPMKFISQFLEVIFNTAAMMGRMSP